MSDEAALTMARTRDSTVRTSEQLAIASEKLPRTLDETNEGLARVTSSTSGAIAAFGRLLDEAREDARATRDERQRILADVSALTSSARSLLARIEESSRGWDDRSRELADQESRAAKALAQMTEASARVSESIARLSTIVEPDLASASRSVASILGDTAKLTKQLSSEERAAPSFSVAIGAAAGLGVVLVALAGRLVFPPRAGGRPGGTA